MVFISIFNGENAKEFAFELRNQFFVFDYIMCSIPANMDAFNVFFRDRNGITDEED